MQLDKQVWLLENRPLLYNIAYQALELVSFCLYEDDQSGGSLKEFLVTRTLLIDHLLGILSDEKQINNNAETLDEIMGNQVNYISLKVFFVITSIHFFRNLQFCY